MATEDDEKIKNDQTVRQDAPADALSRTPEELEEDAQKQRASRGEPEPSADEKPMSPVRRFFRKINIYLLAFLLILAVSIIFSVILYINSIKTPPEPVIESQELTQDALKQLANTDSSVGNTSQTLTIKGNAEIMGQTLMRGNLNVAGNFQTGGSIQGPSITISGQANLGPTQIQGLQIAQNLAIQGDASMRNLAVGGTSTFSGAMTASSITVTNLTLSGNAVLHVPNHISFAGPTPSRASVDTSVLGTGGSASLNGSDTAGTINVNTGNGPRAGCYVRFNFSRAFNNVPRVIISPVESSAARAQYYVKRDRTGFNVCSANAMPGNQSFAYDYFISD